MAVTTASKLMLANDEIADLTADIEKLEAEKAHLIIRYTNRILDMEDRMNALEAESCILRDTVSRLKNPWWKFW
jgi:hypothetical protein